MHSEKKHSENCTWLWKKKNWFVQVCVLVDRLSKEVIEECATNLYYVIHNLTSSDEGYWYQKIQLNIWMQWILIKIDVCRRWIGWNVHDLEGDICVSLTTDSRFYSSWWRRDENTFNIFLQAWNGRQNITSLCFKRKKCETILSDSSIDAIKSGLIEESDQLKCMFCSVT
jgi:hypothetical protein